MASLRSTTVSAILTAAIGCLLASCRRDAAVEPQAPVVPTATATPATLADDLELTAEFRPYQDIDVMAKVSGYVKEIRVDIGDHVKKGDIVAILEVPEIAAEVGKARADVESSEAAAQLAHLSYARLLDVSARDKDLVPQQDLDAAKSRDLAASGRLASARSALGTIEAMMKYATIHAPFSGIITKRYADVGSMIQAGISSQAKPVVRLAQNDPLRLVLPVPVTAAGEVRTGQQVEIGVQNLGLRLTEPIARYANLLEMTTRTMRTEVDVPNPDGRLIPGMYARVRLHLAARSDVLSVPLDAVDGLGTSLEQAYLVRGGEVHLVRVVTGLQTPDRIEIVSGLAKGDEVIVGRHGGLYEGEKVDPKPASYESGASG